MTLADTVEEVQGEISDVEARLDTLRRALADATSCETAADLRANLQGAIDEAKLIAGELGVLRARVVFAENGGKK